MNPYDEGYNDGQDDNWNNPYWKGTQDYEDYEDGFDEGAADAEIGMFF